MLSLPNEPRAVAVCFVLFLAAAVTREFIAHNYSVDAEYFNERFAGRDTDDMPRETLSDLYRIVNRLHTYITLANVFGALGEAFRFLTLLSALILVF